MAGMSGGSMLRTRRKDVNVKPNRRLDRKSSRGMLYENEELRLRTININAEVERGQSDIKKLKRENEQLRREVGALRGEYDRLERLLHQRQHQESPEPENQEEDKISIISCCSDCSDDCCKIQNRAMCCKDATTCDSANVVKCPRFPTCHSLEMDENRTTSNKRYYETCQNDADAEKNECEDCQKEKNYASENDCQNCNACENIINNNNNKNNRNTSRQNKINLNLKMEQNKGNVLDNRTSGGAVVDCQNETNENDVNVASDCGRLFSDEVLGEERLDEGFPDDYLGCRRLDIARCCGTLLSPVPEEGNVPRSPMWISEGSSRCSCRPNSNQEQTENNNMENIEPESYKAVVTVPLTSHIPIINNETDKSIRPTAHGQENMTNMSEAIPVFPKTGLDILMNNNCYEKFEGFSTTHPLGFIVPPPLNSETNVERPYQIVPNAELFHNAPNRILDDSNICSNFYDRTLPFDLCSTNASQNLPFGFRNAPPYPTTNSSDVFSILNDSNLSSSHNDPFIFTDSGSIVTSIGSSYVSCSSVNVPSIINTTMIGSNGSTLQCSNNGHFMATSSRNNDNFQTNTVMTTNGLIFTSNCPIMSSNEATRTAINPSISPTNSLATNNTSSITPNSLTTIVPFVKGNGEHISNDSFSDIDSIITENGAYKDSFFVCKTRKIIQHLTTVHNSNFNSVTSPCGCTCKCNQKPNAEPSQEVTNEIFTSVSDRNSKSTSFRTEKSIELNYDYPKPLNLNEDIKNDGASKSTEEIKISSDTTQTVQTTTEVNSTLFLFERKKVPLKSKHKHTIYERSNSAPVEIPSDEPIYATVNKLPKKLRRLNIRNLENEIKYVPPEDAKKKDAKVTEEDETTKEDRDLNVDAEDETKDKSEKTKSNGVVNKTVTKSDSFSESSDKNTTLQKNAATVRKKKKFSIRFKRKCSKISKTNSLVNCKTDESKQEETDVSRVSSDRVELVGLTKNSSEKSVQLDASSSPDSPSDAKCKEIQPNYCKKHGKPKHCHRHHYKAGCDSPRCYREDVNGCSKHQSVGCHADVGMKKHPSRSYYKQDSYQEMTTSHSERERTNSLSSSGHSGFSLGSKARNESHSRREGSIPWCGCWGNSCL